MDATFAAARGHKFTAEQLAQLATLNTHVIPINQGDVIALETDGTITAVFTVQSREFIIRQSHGRSVTELLFVLEARVPASH